MATDKDETKRPLNPHVARGLWFASGAIAAVAVWLTFDGWWTILAAVVLLVIGHDRGEKAFNRLATRQEIKDDLRHRIDTE